MFKYKAIVFDLDNTIFKEIDYLKKAYKYIANQVIKKENKKELNTDEIYFYLLNTFQHEGRSNLYQKMCIEFDIRNFSISDFLICLRTVSVMENEIKINKLINNFIIAHFDSKLFFILTNGNESQQKNKIKSLHIPHKNKINIIYSSSLGKEYEKPNPYFLIKIMKDYKLGNEEVLFIGNSLVDQKTAEQASVDFLSVNEFKLF